jgi:hypothetical protein
MTNKHVSALLTKIGIKETDYLSSYEVHKNNTSFGGI